MKFATLLLLSSAFALPTPRQRTSPLQSRSLLRRRGRSSIVRRQASSSADPLIDEFHPGSGDLSYYTAVSVGSPAQTFHCTVDTGSGILLLPSQCTSAACEGVLDAQYDPTKSSSAKVSQATMTAPYGSLTAAGTIVSDTVSIAGFQVTNFPFLAATQISDQNVNANTPLPYATSECIIGLGYNLSEISPQDNFFNSLVNGNVLASPQFGLYLGRYSTDWQTSEATTTTFADDLGPSELMLGGVDSTRFQGQIVTFPLLPFSISRGFWAIASTGIAINHQVVPVTGQSQFSAIFDSGTSLMALSAPLLQILVQSTSAVIDQTTGLYQISCSQKPPVVGFGFGSRILNLAMDDLVLIYRQQCYLAVQSTPAGSDVGADMLLGDTFLKSWYSIHTGGASPSIGFAVALHNVSFPTTSSSAGGAGTSSPVGGTSTTGAGSSTGASTSGGSSTGGSTSGGSSSGGSSSSSPTYGDGSCPPGDASPECCDQCYYPLPPDDNGTGGVIPDDDD